MLLPLLQTHLLKVVTKIKRNKHHSSLHDPQHTYYNYLQTQVNLANPSVSIILRAGITHTHITPFMKPKFQCLYLLNTVQMLFFTYGHLVWEEIKTNLFMFYDSKCLLWEPNIFKKQSGSIISYLPPSQLKWAWTEVHRTGCFSRHVFNSQHPH